MSNFGIFFKVGPFLKFNHICAMNKSQPTEEFINVNCVSYIYTQE